MIKICDPWNESLISVYKSALSEFHSAVPAHEVLYLRWILGHKIVRRSNFETPKSVPTKAQFQAGYVLYSYYG